MKNILTVASLLTLFTLVVRAQKTDLIYSKSSVLIDKIKITENITLYKTGSTNAYPNMIALRTEKGIIIFDTHAILDMTKKIKAMIEADYGNNIAYVVNTHAWFDHTNGNIVFKDVPIIGNDKGPKTINGLVKAARNPETEKRMEKYVKQMEDSLPSYKGDLRAGSEAIDIQKAMMELKINGAVLPTILFNDKMSLTLGSTSLHLFSNTTSYSDNDIIIEIPEEHTLIVGDIFNKNRLPWLDSKTDFTFMNKLFASYISDSSTVYNFIGGHGYGMTKNEIKEQLNYINELKANVDSLKKEGKTISEIKKTLEI